MENIASTSSGSIATIAQPLGLQTRSDRSLLSGKYTTDSTPNTPVGYKRNKDAGRRFKNSPSH
jgi:hypothetical protein